MRSSVSSVLCGLSDVGLGRSPRCAARRSLATHWNHADRRLVNEPW